MSTSRWYDQVPQYPSDEDDDHEGMQRPSAPPPSPEVPEVSETKEVPSMDRIWVSFFNQVFVIAEEAVKSRKIPLQDIRSEEPYLFLGLIGATVFQCAQHNPKFSDRIQLAVGHKVRAQDMPEQHREAFAMIKRVIDQMPADPDQRWCLEQLVLYGNSEHKVVTALDMSTVVILRRLAAQIQNVAIHISQQSIFRTQFKSVLNLLLDVYREI